MKSGLLGVEPARPRRALLSDTWLRVLVVGLGCAWLCTSLWLAWSLRRDPAGAASLRRSHEMTELSNEVLILRRQLASMVSDADEAAASGAGGTEPPPPPTDALGHADPAADTASRHPEFRLAMIVPWLGAELPRWFDLFVASCAGSAYLVDWLIFHEDAPIDVAAAPANVCRRPPPPAAARRPQLRRRALPNPHQVRYISLGPHGMGAHFGARRFLRADLVRHAAPTLASRACV